MTQPKGSPSQLLGWEVNEAAVPKPSVRGKVEFGARSKGRKGSPPQGQCAVIRLDWFVFVSFLFCFV